MQVWYQRRQGLGSLCPCHRAGLRGGRRQHGCKGQVFHVRLFACGGVPFLPAQCSHPACVFRVAVPEFDPAAAAAAKANAGLLQAAEGHLGNSLAELYVAMPTLAACGRGGM
jgi:hypothetical protein